MQPKEKRDYRSVDVAFFLSFAQRSFSECHALTSSPRDSNSNLGFACSKVGVGTILPFSSIRSTLTKPANPDTHSVWPKLDLTLPIISLSDLSEQNALLKAVASQLSPALVPVPRGFLLVKLDKRLSSGGVTVCFHINCLPGIKPSCLVSTLNSCILTDWRWHCDARGFAIRHNCTTADDGSNCIAIPKSCAKGLEENGNYTFTSGIPACARVEGITSAVRGEEP